MTGRLEGRKALVTGASRGIGRAIAERFAEEGADLFLVATGLPQLEGTASNVRNAGRRAAIHAADVSDATAAQGMIDACVSELGGLDVLVNNAGVYAAARFVDYDVETFERVMRVNVHGVFHPMQAGLRRMVESGGGRIVNIASTAGKFESPNQAVYNASKHAVVGLTRCAALEHAKDGIGVNAICPGFVETDMLDEFAPHADMMGVSVAEFRTAMQSRVPIGRFLDPQEIADLAVYLASDEARGMTGQAIVIAGGMRMS